MLKYRILTALLLIPCVLLGIFTLPPIAFAIITGLISILMWWEWVSLIRLQQPVLQIISYGIFIGAMIALWFCHWVQIGICTIALLWWLCSILLLVIYPNHLNFWHNSVFIRSLFGYLVILPMWIGLNLIFEQAHGGYLLLLLLMVIWAADSGAYFVGSVIGKHKLLPKVSPNKSWEGLLGGFFSALVVAAIMIFVKDFLRVQWLSFLLLSAGMVLVALLGDLVESLFKRLQGVKDSGRILPGHGGILDRLDSLTACAPIFVLGLQLSGIPT